MLVVVVVRGCHGIITDQGHFRATAAGPRPPCRSGFPWPRICLTKVPYLAQSADIAYFQHTLPANANQHHD